MTFLYFLLMIGGLIFFHELGHYTFARISKVHVVTFSIGFGPTLLKWNRQGTEYRIALVPLGGYVKLLGDDPFEEVPAELEGSAFLKKSLWHRFWIIFGGPLFNLILPFILFFFIGAGTAAHAPSLIGSVSPDSPAARAGLMPGDRITEIDGESVHYWWELQEMISARPGQEMPIAYDRDGGRIESIIRPAVVRRTVARELGISAKVGRIGISHSYPLPIIAVSLDSQAEDLGFQGGDCVREIAGQEIRTWKDAEKALALHEGQKFQVVLERNKVGDRRCSLEGQSGDEKVVIDVPGGTVPLRGLVSGEFVIRDVVEKSPYLSDDQNPPPAKKWGLKQGDTLVSVNGRRCSVSGGYTESEAALEPGFASFGEMYGYLHEHVDDLFDILVHRWLPFGSEQYIHLKGVGLVIGSEQSQVNTKIPRVVLGALPFTGMERSYPPMVDNEHRLAFGVHLMSTESVDAIHLTFAGIIGLFTGDVSFKEVGGPIMVANLAGASRKHGWASFFRIMAILSVSLGLLNLLPIPVLDGGHLLFILIEAIQRKPISMRVRQTATFIGLAFILLLMIMVFKNDIERNWDSIIGFFGG